MQSPQGYLKDLPKAVVPPEKKQRLDLGGFLCLPLESGTAQIGQLELAFNNQYIFWFDVRMISGEYMSEMYPLSKGGTRLTRRTHLLHLQTFA